MTISVSGGSILEGAGVVTFEVTLSAPAIAPVTVNFRTLDGTTFERVDYETENGALTFEPGETVKTVSVDASRFTAANDTLDEADEAFILELFDRFGDGSAGGAPVARAAGFILDNDGPGANLALFVVSPVLVEGATPVARFELRLSQTPGASLTVTYATVDGSARGRTDYTATSGSVTFAPGQTVAFVDVPVTGDAAVEAAESFNLVVTPPAGVAGRGSGA